MVMCMSCLGLRLSPSPPPPPSFSSFSVALTFAVLCSLCFGILLSSVCAFGCAVFVLYFFFCLLHWSVVTNDATTRAHTQTHRHTQTDTDTDRHRQTHRHTHTVNKHHSVRSGETSKARVRQEKAHQRNRSTSV